LPSDEAGSNQHRTKLCLYLQIEIMIKRLLLFLSVLSCTVNAHSQGGAYYGIKGGLTLGTQQWNNFDRQALAAYHIILSKESLPAQERFSFFTQLGYHVKGSSIRPRLLGNPFNAGFVSTPPRKFEFYNISLSLGAKQIVKNIGNNSVHYLFGIRGDFTVGTNLGEHGDFTAGNPSVAFFFPIDSYDFIRRINYGLIVGGGLNFPVSEYVQGVLEFTINPDFSLQYQQPPIPNVTNPFNGQLMTIAERNIRNLTFEVTVGARFLRKIEYID